MLRFDENNRVIQEEEYRAIIVGLQYGRQSSDETERSMDELEGLCEADDIEVAGRVVQYMEKPNTATYIGSGKVEELAELAVSTEIDTVVFNDELTGAQIRNLEEILEIRVIDRTILILDIFADRATSREGKLQVELAQLQYRLPRLTGFGKALSRLGGGIGTRGPGEKKLETDRRHITGRINDIKSELDKIKRTRKVQRAEREKSGIPVVALMGYTNSGKSAIMNALIERAHAEKNSADNESDRTKTVKSRDMLFTTLDTQHRKISFGPGSDFILIDTVGFVSKLPHGLVEAFKSTLEEVRYADLLIHVVDSSDTEGRDFRVAVAEKVIKQIGAGATPAIMAYNKMDLVDEKPIDTGSNDVVYISAKTGMNIEVLAAKIKEKVFAGRVKTTLLIPYDKGNITSYICEHARVETMDYRAGGTRITVEMDEADYGKFRRYEV
ncbi:MAG: GTPase HflX [Lentihominibacter sp.]|jgi:GTP-binding protein HflX